MNEELLTRRQVAKLWQVHPSTVDRYRKKGLLNSIRLGRSVRFPKQQFDHTSKPQETK